MIILLIVTVFVADSRQDGIMLDLAPIEDLNLKVKIG